MSSTQIPRNPWTVLTYYRYIQLPCILYLHLSTTYSVMSWPLCTLSPVSLSWIIMACLISQSYVSLYCPHLVQSSTWENPAHLVLIIYDTVYLNACSSTIDLKYYDLLAPLLQVLCLIEYAVNHNLFLSICLCFLVYLFTILQQLYRFVNYFFGLLWHNAPIFNHYNSDLMQLCSTLAIIPQLACRVNLYCVYTVTWFWVLVNLFYGLFCTCSCLVSVFI